MTGYYGHGNFGDEAMLAHLTSMLRSADVHLTVVTRRPAETARRLGVAAVSSSDWLGWLQAVIRADCFIVGGGGLVKDTTAIGGVELALIGIPIARALGVPVVLYGVGVGVVRNPEGWEYVRRILAETEAVFVRDADSKRRLLAAGVPARLVLNGVDVLFGAALPPQHDGRGEGPPTIGLSLPDSYLREITINDPELGHSFLRTLVGTLNAELGPRRARLRLLGLHEDDECRDLRVLRHVARYLGGTIEVDAIDASQMSPADALELYEGLDLLVGMRLHAIVLAVLAGVPFVALSCDAKVVNFSNDIGMRPWCYDLFSEPVTMLPGLIRRAWASRAEQLSRLRDLRIRLHRQAETSERAVLELVARATRKVTLKVIATSGALILSILAHALRRKALLWRSHRADWVAHEWSEQGPPGTLVSPGAGRVENLPAH